MQNSKAASFNEVADVIFASVKASSEKKDSSRYTYVIGNNGTGKSRILGALAERFGKIRSQRIIACIASTIHDRFVFGDHRNVRYMGARSTSNAVFLSALDRQLAKFILEAMLIDRRLFRHLARAVGMDLSFVVDAKSFEEVLSSSDKDTRERKRITGRATSRGLLTPRALAMLRRISNGTGRFEDLTEAQIPTLLKYLELNIGFSIQIQLGNGQLIGFGDLSTGEQSRLLLFAKIVSVLREGTIYLIDEPEISMHLHWQMDFHKTLEKLLSGLERFYVVVATHSPIIISEAVKVDKASASNTVAVLNRKYLPSDDQPDIGLWNGQITCKFHSFADVASHEQLVLRYFQTSPYQTREVSVEVADVVLSLAEGDKNKEEAIGLLYELRAVIGLSKEAEHQIDAAIALVKNDLVESIKVPG